MTDTAEVKASIKLRFVNTEGRSCVTARTMSLTKKKTKMEFKSLDGTLKTTTNTNEKVSTSMKCSDLDVVISNSLGVTPAILENVIFCHQEESNWPMLEGITLKKKLDDIFESTRYTKALEAFQKAKKTFQAKAKDLKGSQKELAAHLTAADSFRQEEAQCKDNKKECQDELAQAEEAIERASAKIARFKENLLRMESSKDELNKLQLKIEFDTQREAEQSAKLEKEYLEDDRALHELLRDFDAKMQRKESERRELQRKIDALASDSTKLRAEIDILHMKKGVHDSLQEHFNSAEAKFTDLSKAACQKYEVVRPVIMEGGAYRPQAAKFFLNELNAKINDLIKDTEKSIDKQKQLTLDADRAVGECRDRAQRHEIELDAKSRDIKKLQSDMDIKQGSMSGGGSARDALGTLEREFEEKKAEMAHFDETRLAKEEDFKVKIREATNQISALKDDNERDADLLSNINMRRGEMFQVNADEQTIDDQLEGIKTESVILYRNRSDVLVDAQPPSTPGDVENNMVALSERIDTFKVRSIKANTCRPSVQLYAFASMIYTHTHP